jgi:ABC-type glutathione transport system ATPase component
MRDGEIIEEGKSADLISNPKQSYSKLLIDSSKYPSANRDDNANNTRILEVKNLNVSYSKNKSFFSKNTIDFHSIKNLSFDVKRSEFLGLIGISGSGKTSIARAILKLINSKSDEIKIKGLDISDEKNKRLLRKSVQIIFQDPHSSFDPRMSIGDSIKEAMKVNNIQLDVPINEKMESLFNQVSLDINLAKRLPSELSGGEKQRACIARAISLEPELLICDEPLSALDASTRKDIIELLNNLKISLSLTILLISHDLNLVREICDRIIVLKDGQIIEEGTPEQIFSSPEKEYTKLLIDSSDYSILQ